MSNIIRNSKKVNVPINQWAERLFIVLLFAFPKLNVKIGPLPIYIIDLVVMYMCFKHRNNRFSKLVLISNLLFILFMLHQLLFLVFTRDVSNVLYMAIRHGLPLLSIPILPYVLINLRSEKSQQFLIGAVIFTSLTSVFSSIPATRGFVKSWISFPFLYPSIEKQFEKKGVIDEAIRSLSIIGVSNVTGVLILMAVGILLYLNTENHKIKYLPWILMVLIAGSITTYSRSVTIALLLMLVVYFLKYSGNRVFKSILVALLILVSFTWNQLVEKSNLFNFKRLEMAFFQADDESDNYTHGKNERFESYTKPFQTLLNKPIFLFMGETINTTKSKEHIPFVYLKFNPPDHSLFGRSFYMNGFIVAVIYFVILILLIYKVFTDLTVGIVIIPVVIWSFFAHGMISSPNGAYMFFLAFAFSKYYLILRNTSILKSAKK